MGYSITEKMLYNHVEIITDQCRKLDLITKNEMVQISMGSKYFGNSFKLYAYDTVKTTNRCRDLLFGSYLGMTKKEADLSLCGIKDALSAVLYHPENRNN